MQIKGMRAISHISFCFPSHIFFFFFFFFFVFTVTVVFFVFIVTVVFFVVHAVIIIWGTAVSSVLITVHVVKLQRLFANVNVQRDVHFFVKESKTLQAPTLRSGYACRWIIRKIRKTYFNACLLYTSPSPRD